MNEQDMKDRLDNIANEYDVSTFEYDLVDKMAPLTANMYKLCEDGKYRPTESSASITAPWIYVRPKPELDCHMWHKILFKVIGVFPPGCEACWKVTVKPRNFKELMMLLELQENYTDRYCKCGFEERTYTHQAWGGYFYCTGEEEGQEVYKEVREMVSKFISPDVPVALKRYCTEYELKYGPSNEFSEDRDGEKSKQVAQRWEKIVYNFIDHPRVVTPQAGIVKAHTVTRWMKEAYKIGDETVLEFNKGSKAGQDMYGHLVNQTVKYHKEIK